MNEICARLWRTNQNTHTRVLNIPTLSRSSLQHILCASLTSEILNAASPPGGAHLQTAGRLEPAVASIICACCIGDPIPHLKTSQATRTTIGSTHNHRAAVPNRCVSPTFLTCGALSRTFTVARMMTAKITATKMASFHSRAHLYKTSGCGTAKQVRRARNIGHHSRSCSWRPSFMGSRGARFRGLSRGTAILIIESESQQHEQLENLLPPRPSRLARVFNPKRPRHSPRHNRRMYFRVVVIAGRLQSCEV